MNKEYAHYKNYPAAKWRWPDFRPIELRSKSDNKLMIDEDAMDKLQLLRNLIDKPMRITSAYRSPDHNKKVGGAKHSKHLLATAFDVQMEGHDPAQFEAAARECGFLGFGFYEKSGFMHIDTGPAREWNTRWFEPVMFYGGKVPIPDVDAPTIAAPKSRVKPTVAQAGILAFFVALFGGLAKLFGG